MKLDNFEINKENSDERYICYSLNKDTKILNKAICVHDDIDMEINISVNCSIENVLGVLNDYLDFLNNCKEKLVSYIELEANEELPSDWFDDFDIISVSITINTENDYGAVIAIDDDYFGHVIELYFDMEEIVDCILVG